MDDTVPTTPPGNPTASSDAVERSRRTGPYALRPLEQVRDIAQALGRRSDEQDGGGWLSGSCSSGDHPTWCSPDHCQHRRPRLHRSAPVTVQDDDAELRIRAWLAQDEDDIAAGVPPHVTVQVSEYEVTGYGGQEGREVRQRTTLGLDLPGARSLSLALAKLVAKAAAS